MRGARQRAVNTIRDSGSNDGNVIDWTYFKEGRTVAWAPWEYKDPMEREKGFYTEMSGLTDVEISTSTCTSSGEEELEEEMGASREDDDDNEGSDGEKEEEKKG